MSDRKEEKVVVSCRIPEGVLESIDAWIKSNDVPVSRSGAIVYLLTRGLIEQGFKAKE